MDHRSRDIVGWSMSNTLQPSRRADALTMSVKHGSVIRLCTSARDNAMVRSLGATLLKASFTTNASTRGMSYVR